ncbi:MAG: hypothetical protein Q4D04_12370 [Clostridia bacterium]|nr:hypothetical protein [Clostridia bacterium]
MKLIRRIVTLIMVLSLVAVPMASFAEGRMYSFSIGNVEFKLEQPGEQAIDMNIGATLNAQIGEQDGRYLATISAIGNDEIAKAYITYGEEGIVGYLDGMTSAYGISPEYIEMLVQAAMESADLSVDSIGGTDEDMAMIANAQAMIVSYVNIISNMAQMTYSEQMAIGEDILRELGEYLGDRYEALGEESFEVYGQQFTGTKERFSLTAEDFDKFLELYGEYDEDYRLFFESYINLLSQGLEAEGMEPVSSYSDIIRASGADMTMDMEYTSNGNGAEYIYMLVTVTEDDMTVTLPVRCDSLIEGENARQTVTMDTVIDDVALVMTADYTKTQDGDDLSHSYVISVSAGEYEDSYGIDMSFNYDRSAGDNAISFDMAADINGEEMAAAHLGYTGSSSIADRVSTRAGRLTVSASAPAYGNFEFGIDLGYSNSPFDSDAFEIIDSKPVTDIAEITEEQSEQMMTEATAVGISALGELMQAPGVAELITMLMTYSMQSAEMYSTYDDDDYEYDSEDWDLWEEYEGFEDFEDFEDWEDIEGWYDEAPEEDTAVSA